MAHDHFHNIWDRVDLEKASHQYDELWKFLPDDFSSLLDIGGGVGAVDVSLKRAGKNKVWYTLLDGSRSAIENSSKRKIHGVLHDLDSGPMPFPDNSFDMVFAIDVLEHIMNPWAVLSECRRVSSKYVFVHGPNFAHWRARVTEFLGNPSPQMVVDKHGAVVDSNGDHVSHIYFITYNTLLFWADKAGLEVVKKRVFWYRRYTPFRWFLEPLCGNLGSQYQVVFKKKDNTSRWRSQSLVSLTAVPLDRYFLEVLLIIFLINRPRPTPTTTTATSPVGEVSPTPGTTKTS